MVIMLQLQKHQLNQDLVQLNNIQWKNFGEFFCLIGNELIYNIMKTLLHKLGIHSYTKKLRTIYWDGEAIIIKSKKCTICNKLKAIDVYEKNNNKL